MNLLIKNIRHGFATNSSSSHSIVINATTKAPKGYKGISTKSFGWDNFILTDQHSKRLYLYGYFRECFAEGRIYNTELNCYNDVPKLREALGIKTTVKVSIDHNSLPYYKFEETDETFAFFKEFGKFLIESGSVIYGGNDNSDRTSPKDAQGMSTLLYELFGLPSGWHDEDAKPMKVKQDNDDFILFNPSCGYKVRISFEEGKVPFVNTETKASFPELVDIKITDYCDKGCRFCYQGSSKEGKHADGDAVEAAIMALGKLGTFEVAIGGGEPTAHNYLPGFVRKCKEVGISVAITTNDADFLEKHNILLCDSIKYDGEDDRLGFVKDLSGIGISEGVRRKYGIGAFYKKVNSQIQDKLVFHFIASEGQFNMSDFICAVAHNYQILLLGPKESADKKFHINPMSKETKKSLIDIIKATRQNGLFRIGVDTSFVQHYPDVLKALDVKKHYYISKEGLSSCYFDCVSNYISKSSYETVDKHPVIFKNFYFTSEVLSEEITEIFNKL